MTENHNNPEPSPSGDKPNRIALVISEQSTSPNHIFLQHLLAGLVDKSIAAALICHAGTDIFPPAPLGFEIIKYSTIKLPFIKWRSHTMLIEQLKKFKPTILHCLCETKAHLTHFLSKTLEIDKWLNTAKSSEDFYNLLDLVADFVAKEFRKRNIKQE